MASVAEVIAKLQTLDQDAIVLACNYDDCYYEVSIDQVEVSPAVDWNDGTFGTYNVANRETVPAVFF